MVRVEKEGKVKWKERAMGHPREVVKETGARETRAIKVGREQK